MLFISIFFKTTKTKNTYFATFYFRRIFLPTLYILDTSDTASHGDVANFIWNVSPKCGNTLSITQHASKKWLGRFLEKPESNFMVDIPLPLGRCMFDVGNTGLQAFLFTWGIVLRIMAICPCRVIHWLINYNMRLNILINRMYNVWAYLYDVRGSMSFPFSTTCHPNG